MNNDLTIVIPTIGRDTLSRATASVDAQTYPTGYIVKRDTYKQGAGPTRNAAIKLVQTPWVGFCDDDDWLDPRYHEVMRQHFDQTDMVICRFTDGETVKPEPYVTTPSELSYGHVGISFCVRTKLAWQYPFWNEKAMGRGEDWGMVETLRDNGFRIVIIPDALYHLGSR